MNEQTLPYDLFEGSKPVNFYKYKSSVVDRFFSISTWRDEEKKQYKKEIKFLTTIKDQMLLDNPTIHWDNKIVIEFVTESGGTFYLGCFDDCWSIGLSFRSEWDKPIKLK